MKYKRQNAANHLLHWDLHQQLHNMNASNNQDYEMTQASTSILQKCLPEKWDKCLQPNTMLFSTHKKNKGTPWVRERRKHLKIQKLC